MDWQTWHQDYDQAGSELSRRLSVVQQRIRLALDACPPGPLRVVSLCAGQGRDLLGVLPDHPRGPDVRARLVELDPRISALATDAARSAGLDRVEVVTGDAALTDHYRGMVPADLVLLCGIFGNITGTDIQRTIRTSTQFCRDGATVVWTRHRNQPDQVPEICGWFERSGFDREWVSSPDERFGVGVHRFRGRTRPLLTGARMFTFIGYDTLDREAHGPRTGPEPRPRTGPEPRPRTGTETNDH